MPPFYVYFDFYKYFLHYMIPMKKITKSFKGVTGFFCFDEKKPRIFVRLSIL